MRSAILIAAFTLAACSSDIPLDSRTNPTIAEVERQCGFPLHNDSAGAFLSKNPVVSPVMAARRICTAIAMAPAGQQVVIDFTVIMRAKP